MLVGFALGALFLVDFEVIAVVALLALLTLLFPLGKWWAARRRAIADFRAAHSRSGKNMLIVYSDSAVWKEHIEAQWLPRWNDRAVVFNRSRPWKEEQIEARLWRALAGLAEHTPVVILVPRRGRTRVVRFWKAFREHKFGRPRKLREAEEELRLAAEKSDSGQV